MSVERLAQVLNARTGLTATQKLVLIGIANHDGDGGAWPSIATLARYAEASERTVQRSISALEDMGMITVHQQAGGTAKSRADRRPNLYVIHLDGVTSEDERGDIQGTHGVTSAARRGDTAMSPEPSVNHPAEPSGESTSTSSTDRFPAFWEKYPRKVGKPAARRAFKSALKRDGLEAVREGFKRWNRYWTEHGVGEEFIPHPSKWLSQERYNDTPPVIKAGMNALDVAKQLFEKYEAEEASE